MLQQQPKLQGMSVQMNCSRCGIEVLCNEKKGNIAFENDLVFIEQTKIFLKKTSYNCLCSQCSKDINNLVCDLLKEEEVGELQLGKHYYMEVGYMVFTEYFHMIRGYCCKSNCRHCAYGFNPENLVKRPK